MTEVPSAGWREVYEWMHVDADELASEEIDELEREGVAERVRPPSSVA